jgi:HSP20 family protein
MTELTLWRKQEIDKLRRDMDLIFRRFRREFGVSRSLLETTEAFSMNLFETESAVTLRAELPGVAPEDIQISLTDDALTIKAHSREDTVEKTENFARVAKSSKSFSRTISFPCRIETGAVKATYQDGILEIFLPKCKPTEARGVKIELK